MGSAVQDMDENEDQADTSDQFLTFAVGGETFGMNISGVREIIQCGRLTSVPLMPDAIAGVTNLRGEVLPVVDLARRLGLPQQEKTKRTSIVVTELKFDGQDVVLGVIVDTVDQVLVVEQKSIEPPPAFGSKIRADFIEGLARIDDSFLILLHPDYVLHVEELATVIAAEVPLQQEAA